MVEHAILHIGLHKTGTTSIQAFLQRKREGLLARDIDVYRGLYHPGNHFELHAAALRRERMSPFKARRNVVMDDAACESIRDRVRGFLDRTHSTKVVFSGEGMCYLRYDDEFERLAQLVPARRIQIVMCVREAGAWLKSYDKEMRKHPLTTPVTDDKDSCWYLGPDSWLADIEGRVENFRRFFGSDNVTVFRYEQALQEFGNVIPGFLRTIGLRPRFGEKVWNGLFKNRSSSADAP